MKKMRAAVVLVLSMLAAGALPALAGNVYIPLASNVGIDGAGYVTKVWVTNPDAAATHHFTTTFIQEGTSGASGQASSANVFVPASGTAVLAGIAPGGQTGLLEIDGEVAGASVLVVGARLEVTSSDGTLLGFTTVPAISEDTIAPAGSFIELLGLERGVGNTLTDFSLVNLGTSSSQCQVAGLDVNGRLLTPPSTLTLQALSRRDFGDVLALLGAVNLGDAHIVATCDQPFYAFATVYAPGTGPIAFVGPAPTLAGTVTKGGSGGGGGGTGNGDVTFSVPGTFLNATASNSEKLYNLPAPVGMAYKRATVDWDLFIGAFPTGLFTGVMSFRRPNSQRALREPFCAVQIVNRNSKTILDLGIENVFARTQGPWKQSSTYHLKLIYDLTVNMCELDVSQGGAVIYTIAGPAQWFDLSATAANPLVVDFGQTGIGDGAYYPPVTWSFSNLNVLLEPQ